MPEVENAIELEELQSEDTMHGKYLVFYLDNQRYAIAISYVIDIINLQPMTRVPNCPEYVRGITNLRGKVIPIIDLRIRFGKMMEDNDRTCIVVVEQANMQVGIVVDRVDEVINLPDSCISPPPSWSTTTESRFVEGVAKQESEIYLLLNCIEVLGHDYLSDMEDKDSF